MGNPALVQVAGHSNVRDIGSSPTWSWASPHCETQSIKEKKVSFPLSSLSLLAIFGFPHKLHINLSVCIVTVCSSSTCVGTSFCDASTLTLGTLAYPSVTELAIPYGQPGLELGPWAWESTGLEFHSGAASCLVDLSKLLKLPNKAILKGGK